MEEKGINKRYIITEKTTEEFEKERMKKLSGFKLYESIKEAENLDSAFKEDVIEEPIMDTAEFEFIQPETDMPNVEIEDVVINEEFVEVEKPGSIFGLKYKFKKADFLNENKKYILKNSFGGARSSIKITR